MNIPRRNNRFYRRIKLAWLLIVVGCIQHQHGGARQKLGCFREPGLLFTIIFFRQLQWWSSPYINRFLSADTIVPNFANPQSLNRYSYVLNNPLRYTDPTGHREVIDDDKNGNPIVAPWQPPNNHNSPINDPDWDDNEDIVERTRLVWNALCEAGGWWGSGCPSEQALVTWLLYEEGGPLLPSDYEENMARGMRYRFANYGTTEESFIVQLSAFTAFYNPDSDGDFDQNDWDLLTNPPYDLARSASIVEEIYKDKIKPADGNYMYWWDEGEVIVDRSKWPGKKDVDYFQTGLDPI